MKKLVLIVVLMLVVVGCAKVFENPDTGETHTPEEKQQLPEEEQKKLKERTVLIPAVAETVDSIVDAGETLTPTTVATGSAIWPVLAPILQVAGGLLAGLFAMWRKLRKPLTEAQGEAKQFYGITAALVESIKQWKLERPDDWEYLEAKIVSAIGSKAENVIRALRGLPPKD